MIKYNNTNSFLPETNSIPAMAATAKAAKSLMILKMLNTAVSVRNENCSFVYQKAKRAIVKNPKTWPKTFQNFFTVILLVFI